MSPGIIILICVCCWVNGLMFGWTICDIKSKKVILERLKEADRLLDNAQKSYKRAINILRALDGAALLYKCNQIINHKE